MEAPAAAQASTTSTTRPTDNAEQSPSWTGPTRVAFRFVFVYFLLYNVGNFIDLFPFTDYISEKYERFWQLLVPWIASHVLHLASPITIFSNGSGDTTYDYVKVLTQLVIAIAVTVIWSIFGLRRR